MSVHATRRHMAWYLVLGAVLSASATGCNGVVGGGDCIAIGVAGINATIVDALTNGTPKSKASLRISEGTYSETYNAPIAGTNPPLYAGAYERSGTYRLTANATGYAEYVLDDVTVTRAGRCSSIQSAQVTIRLTPN